MLKELASSQSACFWGFFQVNKNMHLFLKSRVVLVKIKACSTFGISNKLQIVNYVNVLIVLSSNMSEVHITMYYMYKKLCLTMNDQKWESSCMG